MPYGRAHQSANDQRRTIPPTELSIDLVADERSGMERPLANRIRYHEKNGPAAQCIRAQKGQGEKQDPSAPRIVSEKAMSMPTAP